MAYPPPPYADALCGTPVCGEAICGAFWVYSLRGTLTLNGRPPIVTATTGHADITVSSVRGTLTLAGRAPNLKLSSTVAPSRAVLTLSGRRARFAGQEWLYALDCIDLELVTAPESELVLAPAGTTTLELTPVNCR